MSNTSEILRGELERLFELDEMQTLSADLLGVDPETMGVQGGKAVFARSLVQHCEATDALEALADAILLTSDRASGTLGDLFRNHATDLPVGSEVAGFKVLKKVGTGGVGITYQVQDGSGDKHFALKVVHPALATDRSAVHRYLTACRALSRLPVEGLAKVVQVGQLEDGRPWVLSEFVDGQSLATRLSKIGAIHFNEAQHIIRGVLHALGRLHEKGLVHGDVKAENVILVRAEAAEGKPKFDGVLLDAASDRLFRRGLRNGTSGCSIFGTAKAIAPEVVRGGLVEPKSDVYGVATLFYEMLTGRPAFTGDSAFDVLAQRLVSDPAAASEVAPKGWVTKDVDAFLARALSADPAARFLSVTEFIDELDRVTRRSQLPKAPLDTEAFAAAKKKLLKKPGNEDLAAALEEVAAPAGAWAQTVEVFNEAVSKVQGAGQKGLLFRIGRIQENELDDATQAEAAYQRVLEIDEHDEVAKIAIEELKRRTAAPEELAELLLDKAESCETSAERAFALRELAELYEDRLGDPENAFVAWSQALTDDPHDERTVRSIVRLADSPDRWNEATAALNEAVQEEDRSVSDKVRMFSLLGDWYAHHLARSDYSISCYGQALALDPTSDTAYDGLIAGYRKTQSWQELVAVLTSRADAETNPSRARDFRAQAADLTLMKLNDAATARAAFEQILEDDPAHPLATDALLGILTDQESWPELVTLLETRSRSERGEDKVKTLVRLGELYEDRLDQPEQAAVQYEAALAVDEQSLDAHKGLDRVFARLGKYDHLLKNLEHQLTIVGTPRQRIALLERIGSIQEEEFVNLSAAEKAFAEIVSIDAAHEAANVALARIYRQEKRFDDLVATLERHADASADRDRKLDLLLSAARVLIEEVGAPERASAVCAQAQAIAPENAELLELLARAQAGTGDAAAAVEAVERLAAAETDGSKRASLWVRAGTILKDAGDHDAAIERYKKALDLQPEHAEASAALRSIYAGRGDAHGAAEILRREIQTTAGASSKAKLLAELGALELERLSNGEAAVKSFEDALALDPTCTLAARGLGDVAFEQGDFTTAARHFEPLLSRTSDMDASQAVSVSLRCGESFQRIGEFDKAQRAFLNARAFAPNDREVVEQVAAATFDAGAFDEAAELYRDLLERFSSDLMGAEKGRVLCRFGTALTRSGEFDEASKVLRQAMAMLPGDNAALLALADLHAEKQDFRAVVDWYRRALENDVSDDERFDILVKQGDVFLGKLGDKNQAAKTYVSALDVRGDDRNLLTKLMSIYSESKDWSRLVEVIVRIAELVTDKAQLSKYYLTAGAIAHSELKRVDDAVDYFEYALDNDPASQKAFDGLVVCLTEKGDFLRVTDVYRKYIEGLGESAAPELRADLWGKLGDMLEKNLGETTHAIEAYEEAHKLEPDSRARLERLADLYASAPSIYFEQLVALHEQILRQSPYRAESYQALRKAYSEVGKTDEAYCVSQALKTLGLASPEEQTLVRTHRTQRPAEAKEFFNEELWGSHILHPEQDPLLTEIFATITPAIANARTQPLSAYQVSASDKRDPQNDPSVMAQMIHYAAGVSQIPLPAVYYRQQDPGGLSVLTTQPPAIGLGKGALAGGPNQALAFVAGRHLAYYRSGHFVRQLVGSGSGLRAWLLAAIKLATPQFPVPAALGDEVNGHVSTLSSSLDAPAQSRLKNLVQKLLAAAPELDMKRWMRAVDLTADRIGFILANDLTISAAVVKASPEDAAAASQKDRLQELYLYCISEEYMALRKKLGIAAS